MIRFEIPCICIKRKVFFINAFSIIQNRDKFTENIGNTLIGGKGEPMIATNVEYHGKYYE